MVQGRRISTNQPEGVRTDVATILPLVAVKRPRWDRQQLTIDWTAAAVVPPAPPPTVPEPPPAAVTPAAVAPMVQLLPWDFQTTFPPVLQDAIDEGVVTAEDADNLSGLHTEHGTALRQALAELETVQDARRRGVDPATGKAPRTKAKRAALPTQLSQEVERLERWWQTLLDTYEAAFGDVAAEAFGKAIRATHAGIEVVADLTKTVTPPLPTFPEPTALRAAVQSGVFGQDEHGPVDPGPEEVEAITRAHAETLTGLAGAFRRATPSTVGQATKDLEAAVERYAADFGQPAADQLLTWCRRRTVLD
jgi:hypothetical protein